MGEPESLACKKLLLFSLVCNLCAALILSARRTRLKWCALRGQTTRPKRSPIRNNYVFHCKNSSPGHSAIIKLFVVFAVARHLISFTGTPTTNMFIEDVCANEKQMCAHRFICAAKQFPWIGRDGNSVLFKFQQNAMKLRAKVSGAAKKLTVYEHAHEEMRCFWDCKHAHGDWLT